MNEDSIDIPIHFKVDKHELALLTFAETAYSVEMLVHAVDKHFFDNQLKNKIVVKAPEKGSLLEIIGFISENIEIVGIYYFFKKHTLGKAFTRNFTGKSLEEWEENLGGNAGLLAREFVLGVFKKKPEQLKKLGITQETHREIYEAKNRLYKGFIQNKDVEAVGFDQSDDFPINRDSFSQHVVILPDIKDKDEEIKLHKLLVKRPVIVDEDLTWNTKDFDTNEKINFKIGDDAFRSYCLKGEIGIKETEYDDIMIASIKYEYFYVNGERKRTNRTAIKVYQYNKEEFEPVPVNIEKNKSPQMPLNLFEDEN